MNLSKIMVNLPSLRAYAPSRSKTKSPGRESSSKTRGNFQKHINLESTNPIPSQHMRSGTDKDKFVMYKRKATLESKGRTQIFYHVHRRNTPLPSRTPEGGRERLFQGGKKFTYFESRTEAVSPSGHNKTLRVIDPLNQTVISGKLNISSGRINKGFGGVPTSSTGDRSTAASKEFLNNYSQTIHNKSFSFDIDALKRTHTGYNSPKLLPNGNSTVKSHAWKEDSKTGLRSKSCKKSRPRLSNRLIGNKENSSTTPMQRKNARSSEKTAEGKEYLNSKDYETAMRYFTEAIALNPHNMEAKYYRGMCSLDSKQPIRAIHDFLDIIQRHPNYNKTLYLCLSIAYTHLQDSISAIKTLTQGITIFNKFIEGYLARGQLYFLSGDFPTALGDFSKVANMAPEIGIGYIGCGDAYEKMGNLEGALDNYSRALLLDNPHSDTNSYTYKENALIKRGVINYKLKFYDDSITDCENCLEINPANLLALYYKGKVLMKQEMANDAIINFEQVVKYDIMGNYASKAILMMVKIKIKEKDFYGAYYTLQRIPPKLDSEELQIKINDYNALTEGVLYIIKRKTKSAMKLLSEVIEKDKMKGEEKAIAYIYRAYGYILNKNYADAITDYNLTLLYKKLGKSSQYNNELASMLYNFGREQWKEAAEHANAAHLLLPHKRETKLIRAVALSRLLLTQLKDENNSLALKDQIEQAVKDHRRDHLCYYFRGIYNLFIGNFINALNDFDKAVNKVEKDNALYYMGRGKCYVAMNMFKEAIRDFSIAIKLNENFIEAYLHRGKCNFIIGETTKAFQDFQKIVILKPEEPNMHMHAGNILIASGAYEQAIRAFSNAYKLGKSPVSLYQRSKCFLALCQIKPALTDLRDVNKMTKNAPAKDKYPGYKTDLECLNCIFMIIQSGKNIFDKCTEAISRLSKLLNLGDPQISKSFFGWENCAQGGGHNKSMDYTGITDSRIDTETKATTTNEGKSKKKIMSQSYDSEWLNNWKTQNLLNEDGTEDVKCVFSTEDMLLYRGVIHIYLQQYTEAIKDLEDSYKVAKINKFNYSQDDLAGKSVDSDMSDIGLCSLNIHEYSYNIMLIHLMQKDFKKAIRKCTELINLMPPHYSKGIWLIRGILYHHTNETDLSKADFESALEHDNETASMYLKKKEKIKVEVFPEENRLCSLFPTIEITIGNALPLILKPSFSFPFIRPPNIIPSIAPTILSELTLSLVDPKPEAPWIKHYKESIKFTDTIRSTLETIQTETQDEHQKLYLNEEQYQKYKDLGDFVKMKAKSEINHNDSKGKDKIISEFGDSEEENVIDDEIDDAMLEGLSATSHIQSTNHN